jgi:2,3-bisphosphoglycerate-dependent phosphoglycerate mutase
MTTLVIARHGNTFESGEMPRRVGRKTDLPLTETGREQARAIGRYLKENKLIPDVVYASELRRTQETAKLAIKESGVSNPVFTLDIFNEIDYGPDENKTEEEVIRRIGIEAIRKWDEQGIAPPGWNVDPQEIIQNWLGFADQISAHDDNETVLVVTSNGIARFAPHLAGDFDSFADTHNLKIATGALAIFRHFEGKWTAEGWNIKP